MRSMQNERSLSPHWDPRHWFASVTAAAPDQRSAQGSFERSCERSFQRHSDLSELQNADSVSGKEGPRRSGAPQQSPCCFLHCDPMRHLDLGQGQSVDFHLTITQNMFPRPDWPHQQHASPGRGDSDVQWVDRSGLHSMSSRSRVVLVFAWWSEMKIYCRDFPSLHALAH